MPSSRRTTRSGRATGRSGTGGEPSDDRRSPRDSGRSSGRKPGDQTTLWIGLAAAAVVLLVILFIAFSGGGKRPAPKPPAPKPEPTVKPMRRDWYQVGFNRGLDWKKVMARRRTKFTRAKVKETAELMTSDYASKGISDEGEKVFVRGFMRAIYGE